MENEKRTTTNWEKSGISLTNYQTYIKDKELNLTFIDLLYISNFKGGNATINEAEELINQKLKTYYTPCFVEIKSKFGLKKLDELNPAEIQELISIVNKIMALTTKKESSIDGFKTSFLSALLHAHFENLIPILDRRILINLEIVNNESQLNKDKQVKKIEDYFGSLIKKFQDKLQTPEQQTIRAIDKVYFVKGLPEWAQNKSNKTTNEPTS